MTNKFNTWLPKIILGEFKEQTVFRKNLKNARNIIQECGNTIKNSKMSSYIIVVGEVLIYILSHVPSNNIIYSLRRVYIITVLKGGVFLSSKCMTLKVLFIPIQSEES